MILRSSKFGVLAAHLAEINLHKRKKERKNELYREHLLCQPSPGYLMTAHLSYCHKKRAGLREGWHREHGQRRDRVAASSFWQQILVASSSMLLCASKEENRWRTAAFCHSLTPPCLPSRCGTQQVILSNSS